jgi:hypothetical protein
VIRSGARTALGRLEALAGTRRGAVVCFVAALVVFALQSVAWPLAEGRDALTYLRAWLDMQASDPLFPNLVLFIKPLAPLLFGSLLELGGRELTEAAMALGYATAVTAFARAASAFGRRAALITALALLLYPTYGALFHGVSSDPVFALVLALWTPLVVETARRPTTARFALHGVFFLLLVLARPAAQVLLVFALFPLLLPVSARRRLAFAGAFLATALAGLAALAVYNELRYDELRVSRTGPANFPLYRIYSWDQLVRPENGSASRELARAVESDLLRREPYRSYRIDVREFFDQGSPRMWADLVSLYDRTWGWDENYSRLRRVAVEAVLASPGTYSWRVTKEVGRSLFTAHEQPAPGRDATPAVVPEPRIVVAGRSLAAPTEGQPVPASNLDWIFSTPDGRIRTDWSSLERPVLRFRDPSDQVRYERFQADLERLVGELRAREGSDRLADALNALAKIYPPMAVWLMLGVVALAVRRRGNALLLGSLATLGLVVVTFSALGQPAVLQYRMPLDPLFILFGVVAVFGEPLKRPRAPG